MDDRAANHVGLVHEYAIKNKYYSANVDIWVDEFGDDNTGLPTCENWVNQFCSDEAKEARDVLGAVIFTFDPDTKDWVDDLNHIGKFLEVLESEDWDGTAIAVTRTKLEAEYSSILEDKCLELGLESCVISDDVTNELGEQIGLPRIREALESRSWKEVEKQEASEMSKTDSLSEDKDDSNLEEVFNDMMRALQKPILNSELEEQEEQGSEEGVERLEKAVEIFRKAKGEYLMTTRLII